MARTSRGESFRMSRPRNAIEPETIFPGGSAIRRINERFATDLPEPDSPTMPSVSPCLTSKLTPSTALTTPSSVSKYVRRSLTASSLPFVFIFLLLPLPLGEGWGEGLAKKNPNRNSGVLHSPEATSLTLALSQREREQESSFPPHLRIERIAQSIAHKV